MERLHRQQPVFSDRVVVNGTVTPVSLFSDGTLWCLDGGQRCLHLEKDVLGFVTDGPDIKIRCLVDGQSGCSPRNRGKLVRKDVVFQSLSQESQRLWCQNLREFLDSFETKYQLHALEVVRTLDISNYDGIVCVSGDGILVEVVNGLLEREDWDTAIKIPLGVIPAGTGNGMAKSLLDSVGDPCTAANAVLSIIRGHKRSLDVTTIKQGETRFFSVLMLAWGLVADIDIESEKYRWMGSARFGFYALNRILHLRQYSGCISFVPAPGFEACGEPTSYNGKSTGKDNNHDLKEAEYIKLQSSCYRGPDINLENLNWRAIDGPFVSVWLHNVPWGSQDALAAPDAKLSDGCLDLILVKRCPKLALLSLMSELGSGNHVKSPYVMYLKVKALILEPGPRIARADKEGIIDADGEVLARGKGTHKCDNMTLMAYDQLQITVDQGLATIFTPV
ncbi:sphingosine kinase 1 isoform X2 [Neltuma alba]|uniref:sphingosine kinase 1 isoform X2 n=1 Tax=Neltuma alba TaxID=207710 RepID=UPI0010A2DDEA|nr:sphingosine kinase 1-like isoform X2 [Prosopis alba]